MNNDRLKFRTPGFFRGEFVGFMNYEVECGAIKNVINPPMMVDVFGDDEQCTGLKDKDDNLVYENDFIDSDGVLYHVVFVDAAFVAKPVMLDINTNIPLKALKPFCIVGTVHNYVGKTHEVKESK